MGIHHRAQRARRFVWKLKDTLSGGFGRRKAFALRYIPRQPGSEFKVSEFGVRRVLRVASSGPDHHLPPNLNPFRTWVSVVNSRSKSGVQSWGLPVRRCGIESQLRSPSTRGQTSFRSDLCVLCASVVKSPSSVTSSASRKIGYGGNWLERSGLFAC